MIIKRETKEMLLINKQSKISILKEILVQRLGDGIYTREDGCHTIRKVKKYTTTTAANLGPKINLIIMGNDG